MGFEDILDKWDKFTSVPQGSKKKEKKRQKNLIQVEPVIKKPDIKKRSFADDMYLWLDKNGTEDKDRDTIYPEHSEKYPISKIKHIEIDATLDLHGLIESEAILKLHAFMTFALKENYKKVLIIHGKGNHSKNGPILKKAVLRELETIACAGSRGEASKYDGGSGALWVLIKKPSPDF